MTPRRAATATTSAPSASLTPTTSPAEVVQVLPPKPPGGTLWSPEPGAETLDLLSHLGIDAAGAERVQREAVGVLARCLPPGSEAGRATGLVVGYVQSGKTLSFTTVAALARDHGFQLVIVIAGTSLPLLDQSTRRLERDLRLLTRRDRRWQHFESESLMPADRIKIRDALADWRDPDVPSTQRKTVLLTVMKHHKHLQRVTDALAGIDLRGINALVIDDEADQASLNNYVRRERESRTYERLLSLRDALPRHSFLQYTATPQAPLLITIIDVLSPSFVELLTPGEDYVGGREFFRDRAGLVKTIPDSDILSASNALTDPPASLIEAMQVFFLGVAAGIIHEEAGRPGPSNRSMMVHPSQDRLGHDEYHEWVMRIREQWRRVLDPTVGSAADRAELLAEFERADADLRATMDDPADLPPFAELQQRLRYAIRSTHIEKLNAAGGATPTINWSSNYSFILVGGQAMDRGFTVEGLTVTYMPRGIGVGNADTVQQRARFFGYKLPYLGFCRVYLECDARQAYTDYVVHEEYMRKSLAAHRETEQPLAEWKRVFFLDSTLKPTRRSVLKLDYMRDSFGSGWFEVAVPHSSPDAIDANRAQVRSFLGGLPLEEDVGHRRRTEPQRHNVASDVPLRTALEALLAQFRVGPEDSQGFTGLRLVIEEHLEKDPGATCAVYQMSKGALRERAVDKKTGAIGGRLLQGSSPPNPRAGQEIVYPGDRHIGSADQVRIQIHTLRIKGLEQGPIDDVPTLAVWLPKSMSQDVVIQDAPGGT